MAYLNNYHLKGSIKGQKSKHTLSGSNIASLPPTCLRNRQADPPRISMGYSKD